ncbi:MAG: hypothetical protein FJX53_05675 [Alphaproteobacteria bacterium]|nr:hypothetical protein [Alphaproteobacteria bacterium]
MGSLLRFALIVGGLPLALLLAMTLLSDGAPFRPFADSSRSAPPGVAPATAPVLAPLSVAAPGCP